MKKKKKKNELKQNKEKLVWGVELAHSALSLSKKEGLIVFSPAAIYSAVTGHAPRSVCVPVISRSGPAAAEALRRLRSRGSHMDLADGLVTGSPYLHLHSPDLALSRGRSLHCSSSPLSESALICSNFSPRRFILFLFPMQCCRGNACIMVILGSLYESFTSDCLLVWVFDCI